MYLFVEFLCRLILRRRVIIYTIAGRIVYRRPKATKVDDYRALVQGWLRVERETQKLGDDNHGVVVKSSEIIAVEIY